jgi:membrane protein YqaA with SNARE-associated domain
MGDKSGDVGNLALFLSGRISLIISFAWGLAEATIFFIVPDVFLTLIALRSRRNAVRASTAALAGALFGGAIMYWGGLDMPRTMRSLLDQVPAISSTLIADVRSQLARDGLWAVMLGPLLGRPYKIYAVEWGANHGSLPLFLLISVPARYLRFIVSVFISGSIGDRIPPRLRQSGGDIKALFLFWIIFYGYYFIKFSALFK